MNVAITDEERHANASSPHRVAIIESLKSISEKLGVEYPEVSYADVGEQYNEHVAWLARLSKVVSLIEQGE